VGTELNKYHISFVLKVSRNPIHFHSVPAKSMRKAPIKREKLTLEKSEIIHAAEKLFIYIKQT
jgi:hypothetical protein